MPPETQEWSDEDLQEILRYFGRHLVGIVLAYRRRGKCGILGRKTRYACLTAFVISVGQHWYLVTAGHLIEDWRPRMRHDRPVTIVSASLADYFGVGAIRTVPLPFNLFDQPMEHAWNQSIDIDYAVIHVVPALRAILAQNGVLPLSINESRTTYSDFYGFGMVGFPEEFCGPAESEKPGDLRGKRIGVPEYQQTWAVWSRGIFADEFGVQPKDNVWYMERSPEKSHGGSTGFTPPPGVELHYIPPTTNMGEMMVKGELDATLLYLAGSNNLIDRSNINLEERSDIRTLFPDPVAEAKRYYTKTGMFPINHTVVVRRSLLEREPWVARSIYDAFVQAKALTKKERDLNLEPFAATGLLGAEDRAALATDPMPYGVVAARRELETIARYDYEQGLAKRLVSLDELFAPEAMNF